MAPTLKRRPAFYLPAPGFLTSDREMKRCLYSFFQKEYQVFLALAVEKSPLSQLVLQKWLAKLDCLGLPETIHDTKSSRRPSNSGMLPSRACRSSAGNTSLIKSVMPLAEFKSKTGSVLLLLPLVSGPSACEDEANSILFFSSGSSAFAFKLYFCNKPTQLYPATVYFAR